MRIVLGGTLLFLVLSVVRLVLGNNRSCDGFEGCGVEIGWPFLFTKFGGLGYFNVFLLLLNIVLCCIIFSKIEMLLVRFRQSDQS